MIQPCKQMFGVAAVCLGLGAYAQGALVISSSDIQNNKYTYGLSYADMATETKFKQDILTPSNALVATGSDVGSERFVFAWGPTTVSFTYKFDFSSLGYAVDSVTIRDRFFNIISTVNMVSEISADGVNWTSLNVVNGVGASTLSLSTVTTDYTGTLPTVVYYRVTMTATEDYLFSASQWNRISGAWDIEYNEYLTFLADFTLVSVPEPASLGLITLGTGLLMASRGKKR